VELLAESVNSREGTWTREHLEHHLHVAREAVALAGNATGEKVRRAVERVEAAVKTSVERSGPKPNEDCPDISNRTKELLDALQQPGVRQISGEEFRRYMEQLIKIARMG
jgi:hypothetical protein